MKSAITTLQEILASSKDREYLEKLNFKQLQKGKKPDGDPKEFYKQLQEEAKTGPVFDEYTLEIVEKSPELSKPLTKWLGSLPATDIEQLTAKNVEILVEWSKEPDFNISKMSFKDVIDAAEDWYFHRTPTQKGKFQKNKVVYTFQDGWKIVELETPADVILEGQLVQNCLKDPYQGWDEKMEEGTKLYSLRTPSNDPRVDIEVNENGMVEQVRGKQNEAPHEKYQPYLVEWFMATDKLNGLSELRDFVFTPEIVATFQDNKKYHYVLEDLAGRINTPTDVQELLATNKFEYVRQKLALNRTCPESILVALSDDKEDVVRSAVAHNKRTPPAILDKLSRDPEVTVAMDVAENPNTPVSAHKRLSENKYPIVRRYTALIEGLDPSILSILSQDTYDTVRASAAENPNTPVHDLKRLTEDKSPSVRGMATHTLKYVTENKTAKVLRSLLV